MKNEKKLSSFLSVCMSGSPALHVPRCGLLRTEGLPTSQRVRVTPWLACSLSACCLMLPFI